jgi:kinesin family protein 2/24
LAPRENGLQFCRLQEDEFVGRALLTPRAKPEQAKLLYYKLWALHIDSRVLLNGPVPSTEINPLDAAPKTTRKSKTIKPGMFFQFDAKDVQDGIDTVMAMGLEDTSKRTEKDEKRYICAVVRPAVDVNGAYELFVANQRTVEAKRLTHEVKLEYDIHTRYYFTG